MVSYYDIHKGVVSVFEGADLKSLIVLKSIRLIEITGNQIYIYFDGISDKKYRLDFPIGGSDDQALKFYNEIQHAIGKLYDR